MSSSFYFIYNLIVSIHRPHTRPDQRRPQPRSMQRVFQSTGLIRGPTNTRYDNRFVVPVSIHRPHTRPDLQYSSQDICRVTFQSTGLIRGPTAIACSFWFTTNRFNPQASYEARLAGLFDILETYRCFNPQASYEARLSVL